MVAFLRKGEKEEWDPLAGYSGVVGLGLDGIYTLEDSEDLPTFQRNSNFSKSSFIETIQETQRLAVERRRFLDQSPSTMRTKALLAILLEHHDNFTYREVLEGLRKVNSSDEEIILKWLNKSQKAQEQALLLRLIRAIPLSSSAIDQIVHFTLKRNPSIVRRAAFEAMIKLDRVRAEEYLSGMLSIEDPDLIFILSALSSAESSDREARLSKDVIPRLLNINSEMRTLYKNNPRSLGFECLSLMGALKHYAHPQTLPALYEWAFDDNRISSDNVLGEIFAASGQALRNLSSVTGLDYGRDQAVLWQEWWQRAYPILMQRYDLDTDRGRNVWFHAYQNSDSATRRILMRLWIFEQEFDQEAILGIASDQENQYQEAAKAVVSELWKGKRLDAPFKKAIVERFLTISLQEMPFKSEWKGYRHFQIRGVSDFPFPQEARIRYASSIVGGEEKSVVPDKSFESSISLKNSNEQTFGTYSGMFRSDTVRAELHIYEVANSESVWKVVWQLGPIKLERHE